jgi:DNA-binding transcriptional ArsR family regulator
MSEDHIHDVSTSSRAPNPLLPIFRSEAQYRLMGELFTNAGREYSIGQLADRVGASQPTASREVNRLVEAGLLAARSDGRERLVSAREDTPIFAPLRDLLSRVYGPPAVVADEFAQLDARVLIFGSYAARWSGEAGPTRRDIDVLVIGDVDPLGAWDAAARASTRLGLEVNVVVRDAEAWEHDTTGFAQQVRHAPHIEIAELRRAVSADGNGGA